MRFATAKYAERSILVLGSECGRELGELKEFLAATLLTHFSPPNASTAKEKEQLMEFPY